MRRVFDDLTGDSINFPDPRGPDISIDGDERGCKEVTVNGVEVLIIKERVQYMGTDGKIITESLELHQEQCSQKL